MRACLSSDLPRQFWGSTTRCDIQGFLAWATRRSACRPQRRLRARSRRLSQIDSDASPPGCLIIGSTGCDACLRPTEQCAREIHLRMPISGINHHSMGFTPLGMFYSSCIHGDQFCRSICCFFVGECKLSGWPRPDDRLHSPRGSNWDAGGAYNAIRPS